MRCRTAIHETCGNGTSLRFGWRMAGWRRSCFRASGSALGAAGPEGRPGSGVHQPAPAVRQLRAHRRLVRRRDRVVEPRLHRPFGHDEPTGLRGQRAVQPWSRAADLGVGTHSRFVFSVDLLMPADRPLLVAFVRVRNPDPEPKPLYWWTNIAAPEEPGVRVLAPADGAWRSGTTDLSRSSTSPSPTIRPPMSATRYPRSEPRITSFRCLPGGVRGSPPCKPTAVGSFRPPPLSCAVASCFVGVRRPAAGTGRSGYAGQGLATSRSRPAWPRRNWSICGWRGAPRSAGRRPTRRSKRCGGGTQFVAGRAG